MEPLKDQFFNETIFAKYAKLLAQHSPTINSYKLYDDLIDNLQQKELKERLRHTTEVTHHHLPNDYKTTIDILYKVAPEFQNSFFGMIFPDYVEVYGLDDLETSLPALKYFTQYSSSEFAIRPFLKKDFKTTIKEMMLWSFDKNYHVRRLASEGCRPRLPWSFQLTNLIEDPSPVKKILENLKTDNELYVRKSVANHLNDISKDNPKWMKELVSKWDLKNKNTQWIVNHSLRTLIKAGDKEALSILGYSNNPKVEIKGLKIEKSEISLGESLAFSFDVCSSNDKSQLVVIDYIIHYMKSNGTLAPKVFKLKNIEITSKELTIKKRHAFKDFSTRKHYSGKHILEIMVSGESKSKIAFTLIA